MRRLILEEPIARAALWSRRLVLFAIAVAAIGVLMARFNTAEVTAVFAVLGMALLMALASAFLAVLAFVTIWRTGQRGTGMAVGAVVFAILLLAWPAWLGVQAFRVPQITDIATDVVDPPNFSRSSRALAARLGYIPAEPARGTRDIQAKAYPAIEPIVLDLEAEEVFSIVQKAVAARGWKIIEQVGPGGRSGIGHIDAIDRSLILGLPDDIAIRIRPLSGRTRVDVRSASRFGRTDFGTNAKRIQAFSDELEVQLEGK